MNILKKVLQGVFLGISLVLPGMSAGTALIILGKYHQFLKDVSTFNVKPYYGLALGAVGGVLFIAHFITSLLEYYPDLIISFLLGLLLSSVILVLKPLEPKKYRLIHVFPFILGIIIAWNLIDEPMTRISLEATDSTLLIFVAGTIVSATMLLPGVSGSSLLIMINLYDDMLYFVNQLIWPKLLIFSGGLVVGVLLFSRALSSLYNCFRYPTSFFIAGLLIGSGKALIPSYVGVDIIFMVLAGVFVVSLISIKEAK